MFFLWPFRTAMASPHRSVAVLLAMRVAMRQEYFRRAEPAGTVAAMGPASSAWTVPEATPRGSRHHQAESAQTAARRLF